jgi:hypothetical protein
VLTREPISVSMSVVSTAVSRSSREKETPSMGAVRHRSEASSNSWRIRSRSPSSLVSAYVPHTSADGGLLGAAGRWSDAPERGGHARPATTRCAWDAILSGCCCLCPGQAARAQARVPFQRSVSVLVDTSVLLILFFIDVINFLVIFYFLFNNN